MTTLMLVGVAENIDQLLIAIESAFKSIIDHGCSGIET